MLQELALAQSLTGTGKHVDFSGSWENQLESVMELTQKNDVLSGTYTSKVSSGGGTTVGDLQGYVDGDLIAFIVHWRDFQSITAWVGQIVPDTDEHEIKTLWQMTKQVDEGKEWASINAGSDIFARVEIEE